MPSNTTNYNLIKPYGSENYNIGVQNDNMDIIDGELKTLSDDIAAAVVGTIPDNSLTNAKLGTDIKVGSLALLDTTEKSSVVGAINELAGSSGGGTAETTTYDNADSGLAATDVQEAIDETVQLVSTILATKTATITTTWTGASAPYTQTITVSGVTANDEPTISPVYNATLATAILEKTAWNLISKIETGSGNIVCTCFEDKPVTAINIQLKGV